MNHVAGPDASSADGHGDGDGTADKQPPSQAQAQTETRAQAQENEFSVFSVDAKRAIITTGSMASFFSPLSSSIYFPALDTIARDLNVSITKINLTVTTYLVSLSSL